MTHDLPMNHSENGSALITAILILFALTLLGISATTTASIDLRISGNEKVYVNNFYSAESGWKEAGGWLESLATAPSIINTVNDNVRNFGNGSQDVLNEDFPEGTQDRTMNDIPYWYNVTYIDDTVTPGSGKEFRTFYYDSRANAGRAQEIQVGFSKVYKVGY